MRVDVSTISGGIVSMFVSRLSPGTLVSTHIVGAGSAPTRMLAHEASVHETTGLLKRSACFPHMLEEHSTFAIDRAHCVQPDALTFFTV